MIARLKEADPQAVHRRHRLMQARKAVAATLLEQSQRDRPEAVPLAAWKSWLLVTWMVVCAAFFFARMAGLFR